MSPTIRTSSTLRFAIAFGLLAVTATQPWTSLAAEPTEATVPPRLQRFITDHCGQCHSTAAETGFDLSTVTGDFDHEETYRRWVAIHDQIVHRRMPPPDADQPSDPLRDEVVAELAGHLTQADRNRGHVVVRRLNRLEYEHTVRNLFQIEVDVKDVLPPDASIDGFDNVGEALAISTEAALAYLAAAEMVTDAIIGPAKPPQTIFHQTNLLDQKTHDGKPALRNQIGKMFRQTENGLVIFQSGYCPTNLVNFARLNAPAGTYRGTFQVRALQSDQPVTLRIYAGDTIVGRREQLGNQTRFASLSLTSSGPGLSWSRSGVEVPTESRPSAVFRKLFFSGKESDQANQVQRLRDGQSILDVVADQADAMRGRLSGQDRHKMDEYFSAIRSAEQRLIKAQQWEAKPKPTPGVAEPKDESDRTKIIQRLEAMFDMMHLALETDSTRFITFFETGFNAVPTIPGVDTDYHMLSHHGKDPSKIAQLTLVETELMKVLGRFLAKLDQSHQAGSTLLDQTMVLFGSNLGNASSHDTRNMPILLAGGGFKHGQHLAFDREHNQPLPQLYVSMLQRLGIETDTFATTTGTLPGLEFT